jgi:hypothetical protein
MPAGAALEANDFGMIFQERPMPAVAFKRRERHGSMSRA